MDKVFGIFVPHDDSMHIDSLQAFARGLEKRGLAYRVFALEEGYRACDFAVTFGIVKKRTPRGQAVGEIIQQHALQQGCYSHIVVERGFIHRDRYFMVGWGGLNGRANFHNVNCRGDRFQELHVGVAPWRTDGEHIVLCGQIPWDAAVQESDHFRWCRETAEELTRLTHRPIVFRPHPIQPDAIDMRSVNVELSTRSSLQCDMINAWAVVTYNSNASVEATLAGIPAFVADAGAMGYAILSRDLRDIENPRMPDRKQWLNDLAYTQWTLDEIADGKAIYHLFEKQHTWLWRGCQGIHRFNHRLKTALLNSVQDAEAA